MANISKIKTPNNITYDIQAKELSLNIIDSIIGHDNTPFLYRAVPSAAAGAAAELDEIVGGSIVWNQLYNIPTSATAAEVSMSFTDGIMTLTGTANAGYFQYFTTRIQGNHRILVCANVLSNPNNVSFNFGSLNGQGRVRVTGTGVFASVSTSANISYASGIGFESFGGVGTVFDGIQFKCYAIDLTALFGSTIADYIYSLEQATAGSGIAWLKSYGYLTEDYYGYTANKIESVSVARHVMKDSNDSVIGSYALNPITLRGIPKLNASNQLYYDGDRYEASGRVTRKYGVVDLGSLTYTKDTSIEGIDKFNATLTGIKNNGAGDIPNMVSVFTADSLSNINYFKRPNEITNWNSALTISATAGAYSDATAFKTAMNGVYLIYELSTPTYEDSSPFEANQIVDANGTEEYIDAGVEAGTRDVAIPVGHDTDYVASMTRGIGLPVQPNTDGVYNLQMNVTNSNATFEFETASQALTYTLGTSGNYVTLTPSNGSAQSVTAPYAINAGKVNNHTVNKDVPSDAVFTDKNVEQIVSTGESSAFLRILTSPSQTETSETITSSVAASDFATISAQRKTIQLDGGQLLARDSRDSTKYLIFSGDNIYNHKTWDGNNTDLIDALADKANTTDVYTQTQVDNLLADKQDTITGAATTVTSSNLTASRVLISNTAGKISSASGVTTTEVGYLAGLDRSVSGFYSHKSYDTSISVDDMRGISGQFEYNGSYWMKRTEWADMPGSNSHGYLEIMGNFQRFTNYSSSGSGVVYLRMYANSEWSPWIQIKDTTYESKAASSGGTTVSLCTTGEKYTWNNKQDSITGGATTIVSSNLTASRALISNSSGKVAVSAVTSTELEYLDGVTSNVQTQLNNKVAKAGDKMTGNLTIEKTAPRLNIDTTNVTLGTNSNNGVTDSTKYQGVSVRDSNDEIIGTFEVYATTAGQITTRMYARNEMTDGTINTNNIYVYVKKDGTKEIVLGNDNCIYEWNSNCAGNFRSSLGLGSMALENTGSWQSALSTSTSTTGTNGFNMRKYGNVVTIQGNGIAASARGTVPSGYRPKTKVYVKCLVLGTSNDWYDGYLEIATGGTITVHYINSKNNETTTSSSITVYTLGSWIL